MLCPQCGFENPTGVQFCGGCGSAVDQTCPDCGFANPQSFSFCGGCGQKLTLPVQPSIEGAALIERYLPAALRKRGLSQRTKLEGERREITVLFCDMAGFTTLTENIGSEAAYALMDRVYEILISKVYEFEGTVNELTGDGIMALFGAPIALEDAPVRAIQSALAIHSGLAQFNAKERLRLGGLPPVRMRVGVNTGPVVVGTLGSDLRVEFKVVGDTVNLASRLEQMAEPDTTLVAEATFRLAEGLFRFEALGERVVKGKEEPVPVYRVVAPGTSRTRFEADAERGLTPFVGRERELEILLDSLHRAKDGRGQAVSITAEAGLGKSRLLYEFRKATSSEDMTFLEGRCLSYCRGLPYYPFLDLFRSSFDLAEGDTEETIKSKLAPMLTQHEAEEPENFRWLLELLVGSSGSAEKAPFTPEARKALFTRALAEFLVSASENRPLIVSIEDLHWIDRSSEELLNHLLGCISASKILILTTSRPEYPHSWRARSYQSQLTLNRLSTRETLSMAKHQLGGGELDASLEDLILEKTEGVPFFVEEFLKSLRDIHLLEVSDGSYRLMEGYEDVSVPATIQDVLRARVDVLPDSAKELLKTASVVGREISHEMLQELTDSAEEDLLADLSSLKDAELFYERGVYPHSTYLFKHALTQEVVHDSLLQDQRRELHRKAGDAIETVHRTNLTEHYGVLAEHFIAGEDFERGAQYSRLAARGAHQAGAGPVAIEYAEMNVACVSRLAKSDQALLRSIDARTTLAGYVLFLGRPHEAREVVAPIMDAALALDDQSSWPALYASLGLHELFATEDYASAMRHLEKVLETPIDKTSAAWHWFAAYYLGAFLSWNCEFEKSIHYLQKAKAMSEAAGRLEGVAVARASTCLNLVWQGQLDAASAEIDKALADAGSSHNPTSEALARAAVGIVRSAQGFHSEAKTHLQRGVRSTQEMAQSFWRSLDLGYLGDTHLNLGEYAEAKARYEESLLTLEALVPSWQNVLKLKLARANALDNGSDVPLDDLREWRNANRLRLFEGLTARLIAETLLAHEEPDIDEAHRWLTVAMAADRSNRLKLDLAHDHACFADLHRHNANREEMLNSLTLARDLFAECGAQGFVQEMDRRIVLGIALP